MSISQKKEEIITHEYPDGVYVGTMKHTLKPIIFGFIPIRASTFKVNVILFIPKRP